MSGLRPLAGVRVETAEDGSSVFTAEGADPQLVWRAPPEQRERFERRGAVRIRVGLIALTGAVREPCIYPDWGDGFGEEGWTPLTLVERGVYGATAHSSAGSLKAIRFDPSTAPGQFRIVRFDVEPTGVVSPGIRTISPARRLARQALRRAPPPLRGVLRAVRAALSGDPARRQATASRLLRRLLPGGGDRWRAAYVHAFEVARQLRSPLFAAPPLSPPRREPGGACVVAFYLPQFHPIPENDAWWGRGFTEWTNVSKAVPQFAGHLQPRLPADLGFYDLRAPEVRREQARLARLSGVDAFCMHYYWFAGRRVLDGPLDAFAADETIDLPFALCWANENWTRRWDGAENDVLLAQRHSPEDDVAVFDDMARYMRSPRYLRSEGRPVLVVYRPDILPEAAATTERWRARAREIGLGELFLLCTDAFGFDDYRRFGFDGLVEFPPHAISTGEIGDAVDLLNPAYTGRVYDYEAVVAHKVADLIEREAPRRIPGIMPAWDNEARKPGAGHVFHGATPDAFRRWTAAALDTTVALAPPGERFVFVNAWNEWAEGAYLEPDRWFGHGFAQALRTALEARAPKIGLEHPLLENPARAERRRDAVVLLHLFYSELIEDFAAHLGAETGRLDLDVTFPETWTDAELARLAAALPTARLTAVPNAGRDLAPFIGALRRAEQAGYPVFCKLHSKRSPHTPDGDQWRGRLLGALAAPDAIGRALTRFAAEPELGLLAGEASRVRLGEPGVLHNNRETLERLAGELRFRFDDDTPFAAGTMFWGRTAALRRLTAAPAAALKFEPEMGRIDGTLAHALERAMAAIVVASGHQARFDL